MRMPVGVAVGVAMGVAVILRLHMLAHNLLDAAARFHLIRMAVWFLIVAVRMRVARRCIMRVLCMRNSGIECMAVSGADFGFLGTVIRIAPAFAFQMERRRRQHFAQRRPPAFRTFG